MGALSFLDQELERLEREGLLRQPVDAGVRAAVAGAAEAQGRSFLDVSSNDYLGYARSPVSRETLALCSDYPTGAGASRLVNGTSPAQDDLESALADWVNLPTALLFSSGYAANIATLSALAAPDDLIVSDTLNHASIIDGCRLSRANTVITPHLDLDAVRRALHATTAPRRWVVTESYFSMDGDTPDLPALRHLCDQADATLIVDEAHALAVFGPHGSGLCQAHSVTPDVLVGTLGKALGVQGAFVATTPTARTWLWNRARSFVFSTGFSPLLARLILSNLARARADDPARTRLAHLSARLISSLRAHGLSIPPTAHGPLIPIILGQNHLAIQAAARLRTSGILAQAIRPPTVAPGTARLRITLNARITDLQLDELLAALVQACAASSS